MTEQEKREKVIKGLKCCMIGKEKALGCDDCPYQHKEGCGMDDLYTDAIDLLKAQEPCEDAVSRAWLLAEYDRQHQGPPGGARKIIENAPSVTPKAQEPRVMTLEEAKSVEGYVWLECCDTDILQVRLFRNGFLIEPFEEPFSAKSMNWIAYNKRWRYWTSEPTEEQRKAVKWE